MMLRKSRYTKCLSLIAALMLAFTVVSCGGDDDDNGGNSGNGGNNGGDNGGGVGCGGSNYTCGFPDAEKLSSNGLDGFTLPTGASEPRVYSGASVWKFQLEFSCTAATDAAVKTWFDDNENWEPHVVAGTQYCKDNRESSTDPSYSCTWKHDYYGTISYDHDYNTNECEIRR